MFTPHQSTYFAHWLTQTGKIANQVSRAMASARVDMNPHQIEAACFALKSPLEKGVLLADEVGLGKTIEACLVMAQKWAENKRSILLIAPASLRKQWHQELADKFELPSAVIDSKVEGELRKQGISNPFEQEGRIVICSYEYVALRKDKVALVSWDLVVFDEAHKLRNIYQKSTSKRAKAIVKATANAENRIMLSATPLQNNLMELYGLAQVVDPHLFGDEKSFRMLYVNRQKSGKALEDLKQRIKPLCHRTLRRQVQQEGGINFTNRYSLTQDFTPEVEEWDLYTKLSHYLQTPNLLAINPKAIHLVSIGLRKILASSSFAVAETLKGMLERLKEKQQLNENILSDIEDADDWLDKEFEDEGESGEKPPSQLQQEIDVLTECYEMARQITSNAKGDALLTVLEKAMEMTESLGGKRKAVIFTESCRTQQYLKTLLEQQGCAGRVVLLNGSNNDPSSVQIYQAWKKRHEGSARISGSKTADMKAALVEHFRSDDADILISTEAGGEGINLQFCSLLINYDLPWNPQKIEQRIGRVHRYGQLHDVVVVNFVNRRNPADKRVFQLLSEKLKLFEGVFGASDEVLGAIEGNIDIEKRIYEIYQKCRTTEAIEQAFDQLQESLKSVLEVREAAARTTLLENFDRDVVASLKTRRDESNDFLKEYERVLLDLARAELSEAQFGSNHFFYQDRRYDLTWGMAQEQNSEFFRLQATEHYLAWDLIRKAKNRQLDPVHLTFHYDRLVGHYSSLKPYIGQSGQMAVFETSFTYNKGNTSTRHLVVLAQTDQGERLSAEMAEHLLCIPAESVPMMEELPETLFADWREETLAGLIKQTEVELEQYFEQESDKLERWAQDQRETLMQDVEELSNQIQQFKKEARQLASTTEKIQAKKALRKLERQRDDALAQYHDSRKKIEQEEDRLLDEVSEKLELTHKVTPLFTLRWTLAH